MKISLESIRIRITRINSVAISKDIAYSEQSNTKKEKTIFEKKAKIWTIWTKTNRSTLKFFMQHAFEISILLDLIREIAKNSRFWTMKILPNSIRLLYLLQVAQYGSRKGLRGNYNSILGEHSTKPNATIHLSNSSHAIAFLPLRNIKKPELHRGWLPHPRPSKPKMGKPVRVLNVWEGKPCNAQTWLE